MKRIPSTTIRRMAARGTLEVEHILRSAYFPGHELADTLDELRGSLGWTDSIADARAVSEVPYGAWALLVSTYARSGYDGLLTLQGRDGYYSLTLSLLQSLRTPEALACALALSDGILDKPSGDREASLALAGFLNMVLSFKPAIVLTPSDASRVRAFLHKYVELATSDHMRATGYYALRAIGDAGTLRLLGRLPPVGGPWAGAESILRKAIGKRLRAAG